MAHCVKCGNLIDDGAAICPDCGTKQAGGAEENVSTGMGILAYIGPLFLVPLLAAPNSAFARYHANQGLVLFIVEAIYSIVMSVVITLIGWIPVVGWIVSIVLSLLSLVFIILAIIGIIAAAKGEMKPLPVIGGISILK
ncbi:DUF4870 domain-containing protein [Oscillospiraceae bacterium OttesenSCG-928-F05]|nr:DUF4870 domain-containing protein [Oscillospiraceae bacterium OttesenSCG-928-F05]